MLAAIQVLLILVCLVGSAFFSGLETGVISINRMRLRHLVKEGSRRARLLQDLLDPPDRLLGTTLLGTNLCNVMVSVIAASLAFSVSEERGPTVSAVVVTCVLLVFGEYVPKAWFQARPYRRCRPFADALHLSWRVMRPLVVAVTAITRVFLRNGGDMFGRGRYSVNREELKVLAHDVERGGMLSPEERIMIHRVFELSSKEARQVMVPADQIVSVARDVTVAELCSLSRERSYTRIPVRDDADKLVGIINMFDVLGSHHLDSKTPVSEFMRSPLFISETIPIDDIFPRLRISRQSMCLVRNESGSVSGLLTTEDILREIVGEL